MAGEKSLSGRILMGCTCAVLSAVAALILWVPATDSRAYDQLSQLKIGKCEWLGVSPDVVYADLHERLLKKGEAHSLILMEGIDLRGTTGTATLSLELGEETTAAEYAWYIAELSGFKLYTTPDRLIIDHEGKDYRTWRKKVQDWFKDVPKQFSNEPPDPFRLTPSGPSYSL